MPCCTKCHAHFANHVVIEGKIRNLQNRKYCLECSPFAQHNTKQLDKTPTDALTLRKCVRCKRTLPTDDFYTSRGGTKSLCYCKQCTNSQTVERQQRLKQKCVEYKGGCCQLCGYDRYIGALEFHHIDATAKDFSLAHTRSTTFEKVRSELDKCLLVCANCHRELHAEQKGLFQRT